MTIWNLGSVNADRVYRLPHLPQPGETLSSTEYSEGLGGKGANMSVAIARAGGRVEHIGAVGSDGVWMRERLASAGVGVDHLSVAQQPSGHAIIAVDAQGENQIIVYSGANRVISVAHALTALDGAEPGDIAICQNETNGQEAFLSAARSRDLTVAYAAAPFELAAVQAVINDLDLLILNAVEAAQLEAALQTPIDRLPVGHIVITLGEKGCRWIDTVKGEIQEFPAPKVEPVDTTGAGDTFTGYLLAALDAGDSMEDAIALALKAGALMVTRPGTAEVIPARVEVDSVFP
ncbi:ribokinase [Pseudooceanicola sp. C21-150M6]|uniref:ribokinase n=1 Tax=Pseudooceanicola sp. C21-150M6 TaxID=3434355 RepID=UPI003D7F92A7